ncbi:MAG: TolC family protein [Gammaproteobacteria bacterium]|nr:TolC family protein [Gammaproteobacteria bacterium]
MFNIFYLKCRKSNWAMVFGGMLSCVPILVLAQPQQAIWTLESSIRHVVDIAPEIRGAQALVNAHQGAMKQAGAWPNPEIELRADDKMGKDDGSGGTDLTQFTLSQALPLSGRLGHQRAVAGAGLSAARAERQYQYIHLETQVARRYHALQLATDRRRLAEQRLQLADELQGIGRRREQAGELSKLERLRLELIRESAQQIFNKKDGEYNEALSQFRTYLSLTSETIPQLMPFKPVGPVPELSQLQADLPEHPILLAAKHRLDAARSGVDLVRAERLPDSTLSLFRERDILNERRQSVTGIGIAISIPLWDRKAGRLSESRAQVVQLQAELQKLQRDLGSQLQRRHLHLTLLVRQGEHYLARVFEPAQKVFDLTRKAYASGEVEILSLIDANNTYFDARERYLELLQEAWLGAAELRLAAGRTLVTTALMITERDTTTNE